MKEATSSTHKLVCMKLSPLKSPCRFAAGDTWFLGAQYLGEPLVFNLNASKNHLCSTSRHRRTIPEPGGGRNFSDTQVSSGEVELPTYQRNSLLCRREFRSQTGCK